MPLTRAAPAEPVPALPAQEGILFHSLLAPGEGVDLIQMVISLPGPLQRDALGQAWQRAVQRHAALRTAFHWRGEQQPVQVVDDAVPFAVTWLDHTADGTLEDLLWAERARGFDPARAPLLRVAVRHGAAARPAVVVTFHHAVLDGRSTLLLLSEVVADYWAARAGLTATPPDRPPYERFARWWAEQDLSAARSYWTEALRGFSPTPLGFAEAAGGEPRPGSHQLDAVLSGETTAALRELAGRAGATLNTVAQAAWALLLSRCGGGADVVFGVVRSCRRDTVDGADAMIGLLFNTLPLRLAVDPDQPLVSWLGTVRQRVTGLRQHQLAPLPAIRTWCGLPAGTPLFESVVAYEHETIETGLRRLDPAWAQCRVGVRRHPSHPLTLYVFGERELRVQLVAHRSRLDEAAARRLLGRVTTLLTAMAAAAPDLRVGELPVLDPTERATLARWGGASAAAGPARTVPARFAAQARATPDAVAVVAADATLPYADLEARANRLARLLIAHQVTIETPVAVALPRSSLLVVAVLAVLKAGGCYVPLDPAGPPARTALVLAGCRAPLVLTTAELAGSLPATGATVLPLDALSPRIAALPGDPPPCPATPDSLAYVSFTSGSTGAPKGVAVPHRAIIRLVIEPNFARFGPGETLLQLAPVAFDASTLELWASLLTGARLVVAPPGPLDLAALATVLREHRVSTLWLTAGVFHQLVAQDPGSLSGVRTLLAGGDVLRPDAVRAVLAAPGRRLVNGYGPTENTTFTCCHVMTDPAQVGERVPIGRPIQQTTAYVLDTRLRPAPIGVAGELYSGGEGLARGYLGRPDLTAERFVADPSGPAGARIYRTGDRARWRADGVLEFLGRLDQQVKIRGFRTEPGETEAVLRQHPDLRDAAVVVRGEGDSRWLAGYVVPRPGTEVNPATLTAFAADRLPAHLRPRTWVLLARLPLTPNGKVDRAALPAPAPAARREVAPPATDTQRRLAHLWAGLLGAGPIGADDDFFALGGDSLSVTRLAFAITEAFGVDLPIRSLFTASTLAAGAAAIDARRADPTGGGAAIPRRGDQPTPHLRALTGDWAAWRWVCLRSAGFPLRLVLDLAHPGCAAAADAVLSAREAADTARHELSYRLRRALAAGPAEAPGATRALRLLRKGKLAEALAGGAGLLLAGPDAVAAAQGAQAELEAAEAAYRRSVADASQARSARLRATAAGHRFREAVAWQNRHALRTGTDPVANADPAATRSSRHRQHQALVASYLQRYCTKNDTIGFFGPVGWARLGDGPTPLTVRPGRALLASRTVFLSDWCVGAVAAQLAGDQRLRPWLSPRRMPFVDVTGDLLHLPSAPPTRLDPLTAVTLRACDGVRRAAQVAGQVLAEPAGKGLLTRDVYATLDKLVAAGWVVWTLEVPTEAMRPDRALRQVLARVDDEAVRSPALRALAELEQARDGVAAAAGDADRLAAAVASLESTFTRLTGEAPTRRDGQSDAGRTLVYEDCRRDVEVEIGPAALDSLREPLALLLESARWLTYVSAALFRRACRDIYRERARASGTPVPFVDCWLAINDLLVDRPELLTGPPTRALHERWGRILAPPADQHRLQYRSADLREPVRAAFAAPRPGWAGALHHSPDLMIAASSPAEVGAGRFQWVLGELHPGCNTLGSGLFVAQHPRPQELYQASTADLPPPRVMLAASRDEQGGAPIRITNVLTDPADLRLVFSHGTCGIDPARTLPVGSCVVEEVAGRLVVRSRDGAHRFELLEVLGEVLMLHLLQRFQILPDADHTPRVTVDELVLCRESWSFPPAGLPFAERDEAARYLEVRRWRRAHGLPRYLFVRTSIEPKPFFVDLASLASVDLLARAAGRAAAGSGRPGRVTVTEMLPEPDQLWLTDAAGDRYTSELRLVAVDRRHAGSEGAG